MPPPDAGQCCVQNKLRVMLCVSSPAGLSAWQAATSSSFARISVMNSDCTPPCKCLSREFPRSTNCTGAAARERDTYTAGWWSLCCSGVRLCLSARTSLTPRIIDSMYDDAMRQRALPPPPPPLHRSCARIWRAAGHLWLAIMYKCVAHVRWIVNCAIKMCRCERGERRPRNKYMRLHSLKLSVHVRYWQLDGGPHGRPERNT